MHERGPCRCYIIPPHILNHLAAHADPRLRNAGRMTLLANGELRTQREMFAAVAVRSLSPAGLHRAVYDAGLSATLPGALVLSEGGTPPADVAIGEAYNGAKATYDFYHQVFGRKSIDDHDMAINSTVHYQEEEGVGYDNAFWNGRQMVYGDGDQIVFGAFTRSLDVIGHELTHGVTQFECGLVYHGQSGALNESFSDVFGTMVKQWSSQQTVANADWLIGKELLLPGVQSGSNQPAALRSMKAPGTAYNDERLGRDPQPATMSNYKRLPDNRGGDFGGVHINSGIPNHAFYLACVNLGATHSWDKAGPIWYATLRALHAEATFVDAAETSIMHAEKLFDSAAAQAVRSAWQDVGVLVPPAQAAVPPQVAPAA